MTSGLLLAGCRREGIIAVRSATLITVGMPRLRRNADVALDLIYEGEWNGDPGERIDRGGYGQL